MWLSVAYYIRVGLSSSLVFLLMLAEDGTVDAADAADAVTAALLSEVCLLCPSLASCCAASCILYCFAVVLHMMLVLLMLLLLM